MLDAQKALEEKQRRDPVTSRGAVGAGEGDGEGAAGGPGRGGSGAPADDRTAAERRADAEATNPDTATGSSTDAGRLEGGTPVTSPWP
jgi:hypothetical protein